nr:ABC transporter permease [Pseudoflavonifractor phocaeensis]
MWVPLQEQEKDSEKIEKPSLTFLQDGWRRLKKNKMAMVSMFVIIVLVLSAVLIPFFWGYSYEEQTLTLSNTPPILKVYPIQDESNDMCIYITKSYDAMEVTHKGELVQLIQPTYKDVITRKSTYDLNGKELVIDYSLYTQALKEYNKLEKKYADKGEVPATAAKYLSHYFGDEAKNTTVSLVEAKNILEEKIEKCSVTYDGNRLTESKSVWNKTFILGSDSLGRDLFIRVVYGARMSLTVGIFAALVNFIIGVFYGCFAGYKGGNVDTIMMRIVDVIDSVPVTLYVILIMVVIGSGMQSIILALGLTYWVRMARIVRGQVLSLKNSEFVLAARTLGASTGRIFVKHLIPNMMGTIMVAIAMQIPNAIFTEAFLSFIGLGISAPMASWGTLCNDALASIYVYPYQLLIPAVAISVTILAFNLFSDGLRDAFDPKQRK